MIFLRPSIISSFVLMMWFTGVFKEYRLIAITQLVLDVLKPLEPNIVEFSCELARVHKNSQVKVSVVEIDQKTETLNITISGPNLNMTSITSFIEGIGASLHSIDGVEVKNTLKDNMTN